MELTSHDNNTQIRLSEYERIRALLVEDMNSCNSIIADLKQVQCTRHTVEKVQKRHDDIHDKYLRVCKLIDDCRKTIKEEEES